MSALMIRVLGFGALLTAVVGDFVPTAGASDVGHCSYQYRYPVVGKDIFGGDTWTFTSISACEAPVDVSRCESDLKGVSRSVSYLKGESARVAYESTLHGAGPCPTQAVSGSCLRTGQIGTAAFFYKLNEWDPHGKHLADACTDGGGVAEGVWIKGKAVTIDQFRAQLAATERRDAEFISRLPDVAQVHRDFNDPDPLKAEIMQRGVFIILFDAIQMRGMQRQISAAKGGLKPTEAFLSAEEQMRMKSYGRARDSLFTQTRKICTPHCPQWVRDIQKEFLPIGDASGKFYRFKQQVDAQYGPLD